MNGDINSYVKRQEWICRENDSISPRLFEEYGVYRGLRDEKGTGVLTGLTSISEIISSSIVNGRKEPCEGELWYRGYNVKNLIQSLGAAEFGFEKIAYLLLFGQLPTSSELEEFQTMIGMSRTLLS